MRHPAFLLLCVLAVPVTLQPSSAQDTTAELSIPKTDDGLPGAGPIRRYDWFQNLWQSRRTAWAERVAADQGSVVFLGDSITQGWGDDFRGQFDGMQTANRGISGDTTRGMLIRLKEDVLALNPKAVVMLMGTNDLEEGATPEVIAGNFELIIEALKSHNEAMPIIVCEVFPSSASKSRPADPIREINKRYWQIVEGDPQVTWVETYKLFANEEGDAKPEEFPDLLHPNTAGYIKWAKALRPLLETLNLIPVERDPFEVEEGFTSLFNGKDLTGWAYLPTPEDFRALRERIYQRTPGKPAWPLVESTERFDGKALSSDGRYRALHDRLVVMTPAEGPCIQILSTTESFPGDFTLRMEFRATPNADSGVFLRGRQLQCRDFLLAGPYKSLEKFNQGGWNELVITVRANVAHCVCNGEVLEGAFEIPADGPIGLEGDRGQLEYRRIRIRMEE